MLWPRTISVLIAGLFGMYMLDMGQQREGYPYLTDLHQLHNLLISMCYRVLIALWLTLLVILVSLLVAAVPLLQYNLNFHHALVLLSRS